MGIIHRDIKPENVFIIPGTQNVRIGDFTNAWLNTLEDNSLSGSSAEPLEWWKVYTRECIGTREYSAPELRKEQWYGVSVDWWGLGCLVYDLLMGDVCYISFKMWCLLCLTFDYRRSYSRTTKPTSYTSKPSRERSRWTLANTSVFVPISV